MTFLPELLVTVVSDRSVPLKKLPLLPGPERHFFGLLILPYLVAACNSLKKFKNFFPCSGEMVSTFISSCEAGSPLDRGGPGLLKHSLKGCRDTLWKPPSIHSALPTQNTQASFLPHPLYDLGGIDPTHSYGGRP